jgi:hypothetical protein
MRSLNFRGETYVTSLKRDLKLLIPDIKETWWKTSKYIEQVCLNKICFKGLHCFTIYGYGSSAYYIFFIHLFVETPLGIFVPETCFATRHPAK